MEGIITIVFLLIIFLGISLVCIYHVVKTAIKDAIKENRNGIKLLIGEEINNALNGHGYVNHSKIDE